MQQQLLHLSSSPHHHHTLFSLIHTHRHTHTYWAYIQTHAHILHTEELYTFAQFKPRGSRSGYRAIPVPGRPTPLSPRLLALTPSNSWQPHKLYLYLILARLSPQPAPGPVLYNFTCLHPLQTLAAQSLKHRGSESGVGICWVWGIRRGSKTRRIRQSGIDANGHWVRVATKEINHIHRVHSQLLWCFDIHGRAMEVH